MTNKRNLDESSIDSIENQTIEPKNKSLRGSSSVHEEIQHATMIMEDEDGSIQYEEDDLNENYHDEGHAEQHEDDNEDNEDQNSDDHFYEVRNFIELCYI